MIIYLVKWTLDPAVKPSDSLQVCTLLREQLLWIADVCSDSKAMACARIDGCLPGDASLIEGLLCERASRWWIGVVVICRVFINFGFRNRYYVIDLPA
jgi:hypothetical protein